MEVILYGEIILIFLGPVPFNCKSTCLYSYSDSSLHHQRFSDCSSTKCFKHFNNRIQLKSFLFFFFFFFLANAVIPKPPIELMDYSWKFMVWTLHKSGQFRAPLSYPSQAQKHFSGRISSKQCSESMYYYSADYHLLRIFIHE